MIELKHKDVSSSAELGHLERLSFYFTLCQQVTSSAGVSGAEGLCPLLQRQLFRPSYWSLFNTVEERHEASHKLGHLGVTGWRRSRVKIRLGDFSEWMPWNRTAESAERILGPPALLPSLR